MLAAPATADDVIDYDPTERRPVVHLVKDPTKRATERWSWVEDPTATETAAERHDRLQRDHRPVDINGVAKIISREYPTVKGIRHDDEAQRLIRDKARAELDPAAAASWSELENQQLLIPISDPAYFDLQRQLDDIDRRIEQAAEQDASPNTQQALYRFREATEKLDKAIPRPRDIQGQTPIWYVSDIVRWRRRRKLNNIWGDREENRGRPQGSATKR